LRTHPGSPVRPRPGPGHGTDHDARIRPGAARGDHIGRPRREDRTRPGHDENGAGPEDTGDMNVNALGTESTDAVRSSIASLLRVGEPGDGLLKRLVDEIGPIATHAIITAVAAGDSSPQEAVAALISAGTEAIGTGAAAAAGTEGAGAAGTGGVGAAGAGTAADGTSAGGHGQLAEAIERWAVRAGDRTGGGDLERVARIGDGLVIPGDEDGPAPLDVLGPAAPLGLWVRGTAGLNAVLRRAVAVVAARAASNYGTKCDSDLAWDLDSSGITVVSGGA